MRQGIDIGGLRGRGLEQRQGTLEPSPASASARQANPRVTPLPAETASCAQSERAPEIRHAPGAPRHAAAARRDRAESRAAAHRADFLRPRNRADTAVPRHTADAASHWRPASTRAAPARLRRGRRTRARASCARVRCKRWRARHPRSWPGSRARQAAARAAAHRAVTAAHSPPRSLDRSVRTDRQPPRPRAAATASSANRRAGPLITLLRRSMAGKWPDRPRPGRRCNRSCRRLVRFRLREGSSAQSRIEALRAFTAT